MCKGRRDFARVTADVELAESHTTVLTDAMPLPLHWIESIRGSLSHVENSTISSAAMFAISLLVRITLLPKSCNGVMDRVTVWIYYGMFIMSCVLNGLTLYRLRSFRLESEPNNPYSKRKNVGGYRFVQLGLTRNFEMNMILVLFLAFVILTLDVGNAFLVSQRSDACLFYVSTGIALGALLIHGLASAAMIHGSVLFLRNEENKARVLQNL